MKICCPTSLRSLNQNSAGIANYCELIQRIAGFFIVTIHNPVLCLQFELLRFGIESNFTVLIAISWNSYYQVNENIYPLLAFAFVAR